jgi:hypothetical protein
VPLVELAAADAPALGLRHDIETRLHSALELARLEAARGIHSTYFVLHSAPYYSHDAVEDRGKPPCLQAELVGRLGGAARPRVTGQLARREDQQAAGSH